MEQGTPAGGTGVARISYQPALDGVRALAVVLVLLFHLGLSWMPAGYLGVSVFFTLSGYLITSLLLAENHANQRISLRTFYARRARRLLPASLLCIAAIMVAIALGQFALVPGLRAELWGAVLQVHNWVTLAGTTSYRTLFATAPAYTSPVAHYWSLAIEEQFYLLWPLTVVGLCRWSRRRGRPVASLVVALTVVFAAVAPLVAHLGGPDAAYWATPARLGELLVGASLAAVLHARPLRDPRWAWLAPIGLVGVVVCSATFPTADGPAFRGWLTPFAFLSAALIAGLQFGGPVRTLLSIRPAVWLGRVSYGVYLFHWPVFVLLSQHGWDLSAWGGATLALAITAAVAVVSFLVLERPVRTASWRPARTALLAVTASVAVFASASLVPVHRGFLEADSAVLEAASIDTGVPAPLAVEATTSTTVTTVLSTVTTATASTSPAPSSNAANGEPTSTVGEVRLPLPPPPSRPVRILVVGDSTAFYVGQGLAQWSVAHPEQARLDMRWCQGCGFILDGTITSFDAASYMERSRVVVRTAVPDAVRRLHPDVVVLMSTIDDVANRRWTASEGVLTPRDAAFRARMKAEYLDLTTTLIGLHVPHIVWVIPPTPESSWSTPEMGEKDRYAIQHSVIRQVVAAGAAAGGSVTAVDMDAWLRNGGHAFDTTWRPDGTHLDEQSAGWLVSRWFGPLLVETATGATPG